MGAMWRRGIDLFGSHSGTRLLFMRSEIIGNIISVIIIIIIIIIIISLSPLFRVAIHVFLRQTMSLGDTLLQLFSICSLCCLYV